MASATRTESVKVLAASLASGWTKTMVASGAAPMNLSAGKLASAERPFPAAIPATWVPWLDASGSWRTTENGSAAASAWSMSAPLYSTP